MVHTKQAMDESQTAHIHTGDIVMEEIPCTTTRSAILKSSGTKKKVHLWFVLALQPPSITLVSGPPWHHIISTSIHTIVHVHKIVFQEQTKFICKK